MLCHCDNQVVVAALRSRSSKAKGIMHLLHCVVFIETSQCCYLHPAYVDTKSNNLADDLSRDHLSYFLSKAPEADWCLCLCSIYRRDITALETSVQHYFQHGLATLTQRTYQAAMKRFHSFCIAYNILNPFPLTENLLCSCAAYSAVKGPAQQTGKSYLSALRNMQISMGPPGSQGAVILAREYWLILAVQG